MNSIEIYALIFQFLHTKKSARATFARLCKQGLRYFETWKRTFADKIQKSIMF